MWISIFGDRKYSRDAQEFGATRDGRMAGFWLAETYLRRFGRIE